MTETPPLTQRAQVALAAANHEAQRLRHEYIGTEHVLLGLARDRHSLASAVLHNLGVDVESLPDLIDRLVKTGSQLTPSLTVRPYTSRAKRALELARDAAAELKDPYIGTEHLLIGLIDERRGIAGQILEKFGVSGDRVRRDTVRLLGARPRRDSADA